MTRKFKPTKEMKEAFLERVSFFKVLETDPHKVHCKFA